MGLKDKYKIERIEYSEAMRMVVENHYLHRKAPCSFAFGLIDKDTDKTMGVVVYGVPASPSLLDGLCGEEQRKNIYELTRLWIDDSIGKNAESFLIGNTLKLVDKEIIVSYAEIQQGHRGVVYQATNWTYTGLSSRHCEWWVDGKRGKHCRHEFDKYGGIVQAKKVLGERMTKHERPRKHRYVYFNCTKRRKVELMDKLRYGVCDYPKP